MATEFEQVKEQDKKGSRRATVYYKCANGSRVGFSVRADIHSATAFIFALSGLRAKCEALLDISNKIISGEFNSDYDLYSIGQLLKSYAESLEDKTVKEYENLFPLRLASDSDKSYEI